MSEPRDKQDNQSVFSEPTPESMKVMSETTALFVVDTIIDLTITKKQAKDKAFKETLKHFSQSKVLKNFNEIDRLNTYETKKIENIPGTGAGKEPSALYVDSLLPVSADIYEENTYKNNLKNQIDFSCQVLTPDKKRAVILEEGEKYHKLDFFREEVEDDGFTKELRKMQEEKTDKIERQEQAKKVEAEALAAKLKEKKKKEKEEKFSYDYNGGQLKIKLENKANLVSKMVRTNPSGKTKINKEACDDKNPTTIEDFLMNGLKKNKSPLLNKRRDDAIKFNDNRSLVEGLDVKSPGVKYTYEGKTKQIKKKSYSTAHLKQTMNERRLTKEQFARVKLLNGPQSGSHTEQPINNDLQKKKSKSTANLFKSVKQQSPERIITNNENLKSKLLQRTHDFMDDPNKEVNPEEPQLPTISLGYTDVFNLNYLKSGGSLKIDTGKKTLASSGRSSNFLPKIPHTSSISNYPPKEREKIKDSQKLIHELRKRFDDKLRT